MLTNIPVNLMRMLEEKPSQSMEINWGSNKLRYLNHHECHAAFGFFQSPFLKADILTMDGHGETETCLIAKGLNKKIEKIHSIEYPHSFGLFYGTFTNFLGFKPDSDEWKVMALSSYSTKKNIFDEKVRTLIKHTVNGFELDLTYFDYYMFDRKENFFSKKFQDLFGKPRKKNEKLRRMDFSDCRCHAKTI